LTETWSLIGSGIGCRRYGWWNGCGYDSCYGCSWPCRKTCSCREDGTVKLEIARICGAVLVNQILDQKNQRLKAVMQVLEESQPAWLKGCQLVAIRISRLLP